MIDKILKIVGKRPEDGIKVISSNGLSHLNIDINTNMLIINLDKNKLSSIIDILASIYGEDFQVKIINNLNLENERVYPIGIGEVNINELQGSDVIFLPKIDKKVKSLYDFSDIMGIMEMLRSPQGCPWDKNQDHKSIRQSLIEEAYEVVDAIDKEDKDSLKEELGDLLLQVVFHSQIAYENDDFILLDVTSALANKLIYRHPHIFSKKSVENTEEVVYNWNKLKYAKRDITSLRGILKDIPRLPALMYSYKAQEKAADVGFDWDDIGGAIDKVYEELDELMEVIHVDKDLAQEELGDLLFAMVNLARFLEINPELALNIAIKKFIERLEKVEIKAENMGNNLGDMNLEEMDALWDQVKKEE